MTMEFGVRDPDEDPGGSVRPGRATEPTAGAQRVIGQQGISELAGLLGREQLAGEPR